MDYHVYFARSDDGLIKIGFSSNVQRRIEALSKIKGMGVELLAVIRCPSERAARWCERLTHNRFYELRVEPMWQCEWFYPRAPLRAYIQRIPNNTLRT